MEMSSNDIAKYRDYYDMNTVHNPTIRNADNQPASGGFLRSFSLALRDIKLAHSVFALPFAVLAAFLATPATTSASQSGLWGTFAWQLGLIAACMVCARTWAMLVNRLVDARIDASNPRTSGRVFASGQLSLITGWRMASLSAILFVAACGGFWFVDGNLWPLMLSLPTLGWIALYSLTKRFTALSHIFLGGALGFSPIAAAIAIDPRFLGHSTVIWWLAAMVVLWVAGFDVLYALQDESFDRDTGLHSFPSRLGAARAVQLSRLMHVLSVVALVMASREDPRLGMLFGITVVLVGFLLATEHVVLQRRGLAGLPVAFFLVNGIVSVLLGTTGIVDILVQ
jgi:4-hydroxybenzoate polyprenyltransferase